MEDDIIYVFPAGFSGCVLQLLQLDGRGPAVGPLLPPHPDAVRLLPAAGEVAAAARHPPGRLHHRRL